MSKHKSSNQQLDGQVEEIQALDAELADAHEKIAILRSVRAEAEKAVEIGTGERARVAGLHDWFSTATSTCHALVSLLSAHSGGVEECVIGDVVDTHVMENDVPGLVWAVLARARPT
ncbi:uncharacterized protein F5147DRAFT_651052 [Suillus discolor]|uniref:Uncharacterized protein n=1 Tax=Suillus discolor TaxID=1912936 RepID=A0A9P7FAA9_9AGAM|nr:uncharacterized protein F5147DRAFT_651052 [Suillus discolor]KAG2111923.1 hypothetical protein F5147DRAFT_651052 [Suillus discolor]